MLLLYQLRRKLRRHLRCHLRCHLLLLPLLLLLLLLLLLPRQLLCLLHLPLQELLHLVPLQKCLHLLLLTSGLSGHLRRVCRLLKRGFVLEEPQSICG